MVNWLTVGGVILVFLILISPIAAIILEEYFANKKNKEKDVSSEEEGF